MKTPLFNYFVGLLAGIVVGASLSTVMWRERLNDAHADHMKTVREQQALIEAVEKDRQVRAELKALQASRP